MTIFKLLLLPGDGIGPEVMAEVEKIIDCFASEGVAKFETEKGLVGGCAYDAHGKAISEADMALAGAADAILFAAVGGPKWDCARTSPSTPICGRRSATRRSLPLRRSNPRSSRGSTS